MITTWRLEENDRGTRELGMSMAKNLEMRVRRSARERDCSSTLHLNVLAPIYGVKVDTCFSILMASGD